MRERFVGRESREDRPLITLMLNNKERLGLSADQVKKLEQFRDNFQKQSIRHDADLRIVELDLAALLDHDPVELSKVEAKVREAEKLRADLRIARIRAIEQARSVLNAEQKKKLQEITAEARPPRPAREGLNPPAKE
jgi:Spy/CpxP family protein refolding chaperone